MKIEPISPIRGVELMLRNNQKPSGTAVSLSALAKTSPPLSPDTKVHAMILPPRAELLSPETLNDELALYGRNCLVYFSDGIVPESDEDVKKYIGANFRHEQLPIRAGAILLAETLSPRQIRPLITPRTHIGSSIKEFVDSHPIYEAHVHLLRMRSEFGMPKDEEYMRRIHNDIEGLAEVEDGGYIPESVFRRADQYLEHYLKCLNLSQKNL